MSYTAALGYTPAFSVTKDGTDITSAFLDRVLSIRFSSFEGGGDSDTVDIDIDDRGWTIDLPNVGDSGVTLGVTMGYVESGLHDCGTFKMEEVNLSSPPKGMALRGNSVGLNTNVKAPMITSHDGQTLGQIIGNIATSAGVTAQVDPDLANITVEYLNQNSSSGHLLQDLESRFNGLAKFSNGYLSFTKRGTGNNVSGNSIGTVTLDSTDIADLKIRLTNVSSFSKVRASYWDKQNHKLVWVQSSVPGDSASTVSHLISKQYNTEVEAQAAADAQMSVLNRQGVTGSLTLAKGDASIRGGSTITITGTRDGIDGTYIVNTAVHTISKDGGLISTLDFSSEDGAGSVGTSG